MDARHLPRRKATTFAPETSFDLSNAFVVPLKNIPIDGLIALKNGGEAQLSGISIPSSSDGPHSPSSSQSDKEVMYKTVASVPIDEPEMVYKHLLQLTQCYEAMAGNQKVVAFTNEMPVKKAFYALVYNSTRTGLIVDAENYNIIGVLSVTDFIMVLMKLWKYHQQNGNSNEKMTPQLLSDLVGCMPVARWKEHQKLDGQTHREFISVDVKDSLYHAVKTMWSHRVHRLPIMDSVTNDCMFILTHRRILQFMYNFCLLLPRPTYMDETVEELQLGCWDNIKYVEESTPLIETLDLLIEGKISGVPVVRDNTTEVIHVYTRFDAIAVAFDENFMRMDMSVAEAIEKRKGLLGGRPSVVTIPVHSTAWSAFEKFIEKKVHRLFAVDARNNLQSVISLSDMIWYMVLRPSELSDA